MDVYASYKNEKAEVFQRLVGVNKGTFSIILEKFILKKAKYMNEKKFRLRGTKCSLSAENQVLIYLLYLRNYDTYLVLGKQFGISESYAHKRCAFTKKILMRALECPDEASLKSNIETNLVAVDVCEQLIERPLQGQKEFYSGKKSTHGKSSGFCLCVDRAYQSLEVRKRNCP